MRLATRNRLRGFTLVELMIVVAIIGILASLAVMSFGKYIKAGKIQKLQQIAQNVAAGQERFRSRNNAYYPAVGGQVDWATDKDKFINLLDFSGPVPLGVTVTVETWDGTGPACTICGGAGEDTSKMGFAVRVVQDLNPSEGTDTTIVFHNTSPAPLLTNEGN